MKQGRKALPTRLTMKTAPKKQMASAGTPERDRFQELMAEIDAVIQEAISSLQQNG
ncbi:hypothetical protein GCM10028773_16320 [Spirosoma koreense]